jgi:hypothetical protein
LVRVPKETAKHLKLYEKTMEPSSNLIVNQVAEDEVLLSLNLLEMAQLADPI